MRLELPWYQSQTKISMNITDQYSLWFLVQNSIKYQETKSNNILKWLYTMSKWYLCQEGKGWHNIRKWIKVIHNNGKEWTPTWPSHVTQERHLIKSNILDKISQKLWREGNFLSFFKIYLCWEKERQQHEQRRGREGEKENPKQALCCQHMESNAGLEVMNGEVVTWVHPVPRRELS